MKPPDELGDPIEPKVDAAEVGDEPCAEPESNRSGTAAGALPNEAANDPSENPSSPPRSADANEGDGARVPPKEPNDPLGENSPFIQNNYAFGNATILGNAYNPAADTKRSLFSDSKPLDLDPAELPAFEAADIDERLKDLASDRVLIVACHDDSVATAAAFKLFDRLLERHTKTAKQLVLASLPDDVTIYSFYPLVQEDHAGAAVLVDALHSRALPFVDSLVSLASPSAISLKKSLKEQGYYLVCLVYADDLAVRLAHNRATGSVLDWQIDFLPPLLDAFWPDHPPHAHSVLLEQITRGDWGPDTTSACRNLKSQMRKGTLARFLEEGDEHAFAPPRAFRGDGSVDDAVLFAVTYFQDSSIVELDMIVAALIEDKASALVPDGTSREARAGSPSEAAADRRSRGDEWRDAADAILERCGLITDRSKRSTVGFADIRTASALRVQFETRYPVYRQRAFESLMRADLLFAPMQRIADSLTRLCVGMCRDFPEAYNAQWLCDLVCRLGYEAGEGAAVRRDAKVVDRLSRLSQLLRALHEAELSPPIVTKALLAAISAGHTDRALALAARMRFTPGFDDLKLVNHVLNCGGPKATANGVQYLWQRLVLSPFDAMSKMEHWLPADATPASALTPAARYALMAVVDLCVMSINTFDQRDIGRWPTPHKLLNSDDVAVASEHSRLLVRYLTHPALGLVLQQEASEFSHSNLVGEVVAELAYLLLGHAKQSASASAKIAGASEGPGRVVSLLLDQIASGDATQYGRVLRRQAQEHLVRLKEYLLVRSRVTGSRAEAKSFLSKRAVVRELAAELRKRLRSTAQKSMRSKP